MCAAAKGQIEVVKELLKRGADASIADKRGATAEALARKQNHEAVATLIATPSLHEAGSPTLHKELGFNDHNYWAAPLPAPAPAPAAPPPAPAPGKKRSASDADDDNSKRARPANATPPRDGPSLAQAAQLGNLSAVCTPRPQSLALNTPIVGGLFDGRTILMCAASRGHKDLVVELIKAAPICRRRTSEAQRPSHSLGSKTRWRWPTCCWRVVVVVVVARAAWWRRAAYHPQVRWLRRQAATRGRGMRSQWRSRRPQSEYSRRQLRLLLPPPPPPRPPR